MTMVIVAFAAFGIALLSCVAAGAMLAGASPTKYTSLGGGTRRPSQFVTANPLNGDVESNDGSLRVNPSAAL